MADNLKRKCVKCGLSPNDNPNIKLHRFPKPGSTNMRRCEMWAKYCFPDKLWSSVDFQRKLYSEHRMLCNKHFKDTEFINIEEKKLSKHAVPDMIDFDEEIDVPMMKKVCEDNIQVSKHKGVSDHDYAMQPVPGPSRVLMEITNENYEKLVPVAEMGSIVTPKPGSPQLFIHKNMEHQKHKGVSDHDYAMQPVPGPSRVLMEITNENHEKLVPVAEMGSIVTPKPGSSQLFIHKNVEHQKHKGVSDHDYAIQSVPGPSRDIVEITNENCEKLVPVAEMGSIATFKPGSSQLFIERKGEHQKLVSSDPTKKLQKLNETALYKRCRKYVNRICYLRNCVKQLKRKDLLNELTEDGSVQSLIKKLSPSFALILQSQLRNVKRKKTARRWTLEEKIIALRLYKRSATCYRLLRRLWCLPAPSTLKSLLNQFELNTGINEKIFNGLKKYITKQNPLNNAYILMFDEMAIRKHLWYNNRQDRIIGYQDHGVQGTTQQEATYALVFMVAGIRKKIKQPVAFYLSGSNVTSDRLAVLIKEVLNKCFEIGMNIYATVCDMDGVNRRALVILGASKSRPYFNIEKNEVVAIFDPPHLLKCFRNLFLKYNIKCVTNITSDNMKGEGIAKWSHIQEFYEKDNMNPYFVFAPKLRNDHLNPNTKQKMKVNLAAQVLSHSVAAGMFAKISQGELPADATITAEVVCNIDKLFDAVNSNSADLQKGKPHSTNMTSTSPHIKHFEEMKLFFERLEFLGCRSSPPSKDGWIWTLNGIVRIFHTLTQKHGIRALATRRLQQDPIENLFGAIRANCGANTNPTSSQFIGGLKTTIISNLAHINAGNNCEDDNYNSIMSNFKDIFSSTQTTSPESREEPHIMSDMLASVDNTFEASLSDSAEMQACSYVCGFILKNLKVACGACEKSLKASNIENVHSFVEFKEYDDIKKSLIYASNNLIMCVEECAKICHSFFLMSSSKPDLKKTIINKMYNDVNFSFLSHCTLHAEKNVQFLCNSVFHICVKRFCTLQNRKYIEAASNRSLKKKIDILKHK